MSGVALVYAIFGDEEEARAVAQTVVGEGLAACANRMAPCVSHFVWEGEAREAVEHPVLFKTAAAQREALIARIAALHSYDVPAIVAWDADGAHGAFVDWVKAAVL